MNITPSESPTCPHLFEGRGDKIGDSEQGERLYGTQASAEVCENVDSFHRNSQRALWNKMVK